MTTEKIDKKIESDLFSTQPEVAISAIDKIKSKGNKLYIPPLFDLLISKPEKEIADEINKLLSTIKDKDARKTFIAAITNDKYKSIQKLILTACWQNGLDFSKYLPVFIDIIIDGDWECGFEAFTIIENMEHLPKKEIVEQSINKIKAVMEDVTEQKVYFLQEIIAKLN